ncbi:MAG: ATP-binding protein [Chloroflexi bacterium]|nr:ATP-binding protein [Chloroflexota bacterium]
MTKSTKALEATGVISILKSVLLDRAVSLALKLLARESESDDADRAELFNALAESAELARQPVVGDAWRNYLLDLILADDNVFSRKAELVGVDDIGPSLLRQVRSDLSALRSLYDIDVARLLDGFSPLDGFRPLADGPIDGALLSMKRRMDECADWAGLVPEIAAFYGSNGVGLFGRYRAFRWKMDADGGRLRGVASPDPIRLADLVEYDWQREEVARNTCKLIASLPANNMLLYGDRGTGKSSTVKAMLNEFAGKKLRLVEVAKDDLTDLPAILSILRARPEKFILFIDDLSFEENETQYKALKAVLEGGLEARPANVALYATSNRRNIIKERFADRVNEDGEVHPTDTMQEKLSLSDRFGLKLPFLAPDQEEFLRIVTALADRAGIELTEDLRKKSLAWQHARSGRSARQFVDYLIGEIGLDSAL